MSYERIHVTREKPCFPKETPKNAKTWNSTDREIDGIKSSYCYRDYQELTGSAERLEYMVLNAAYETPTSAIVIWLQVFHSILQDWIQVWIE